jgi:hypothetical protein
MSTRKQTKEQKLNDDNTTSQKYPIHKAYHSLNICKDFNKMERRKFIKKGDLVFLKDNELHRNRLPTGVINKVFASCNDNIRTVEVTIT